MTLVAIGAGAAFLIRHQILLHQTFVPWPVQYQVEQDLLFAREKANGLATRFSSAYNAAFWLARVALEAAGYRLAGSEGHRAMVFQCLAHTVEWENPRWRRLDDLHRLRNRFDYGDIVDVSESQVETMVTDAQALLADVQRAFPKTRL